MKIFSIISGLLSLALLVAGYIVSTIHCYNSGSYSSSVPNDADGWGYFIIAAGAFFLIFSIATFRRDIKKVSS